MIILKHVYNHILIYFFVPILQHIITKISLFYYLLLLIIIIDYY